MTVHVCCNKIFLHQIYNYVFPAQPDKKRESCVLWKSVPRVFILIDRVEWWRLVNKIEFCVRKLFNIYPVTRRQHTPPTIQYVKWSNSIELTTTTHYAPTPTNKSILDQVIFRVNQNTTRNIREYV